MRIKITILLFLFVGFTITSFSQSNKKKKDDGKLVKEIKENGKVFGLMYCDYYYKSAGTTFSEYSGQYSKLEQKTNAFSFRRIYIGYAHKFSKKFSAKIMFESNDKNQLTNEKRSASIKYAYVKWKNIFPRASLSFGAQSTPTWSSFTEKIWGYRALEKTIMDYNKTGESSDLGIKLSGYFDKNKTIGYNFMIGNGRGHRAENNIFKKYYASINARLLDKKLLFELYGDYEPFENNKNIASLKFFAGFQNSFITFGFEPYVQTQKGFEITDNETEIIKGLSFFARMKLMQDKLSLVLRNDFNDNGGDKTQYLNFSMLAFDYAPSKNIHIMPNVWVDKYIGKTELSPEIATGIVPRLTIWFQFNK